MKAHRYVYVEGEIQPQTLTFLTEDGRELAAWTTDPATGCNYTAEDYRAITEFNKGKEVKLLTAEELEPLMKSAEEKKYKVGEYSEISEELYDEMLNILPPCKWQTVNGVNIFYMSEMMTGNITNFFCKVGKKHFCGYDRTSTPYSEIAAKIKTLLP